MSSFKPFIVYEQHVDRNTISNLVDFVKKNRQDNISDFSIKFIQEIVYFDYTFLAYLLLLKKSKWINNIEFFLPIKIDINGVPLTRELSLDGQSAYFTIQQYSYLINFHYGRNTIKLFSSLDENPVKRDFDLLPNDFSISKVFSPIFFIDQQFYKDWFVENSPLNKLKEDKYLALYKGEEKSTYDKKFKRLKRVLTGETSSFFEDSRKESSIKALGTLLNFLILDKIKLLDYFLSSDEVKNNGSFSLSNQKKAAKLKYVDATSSILEELSEKPKIFKYLFYNIISNSVESLASTTIEQFAITIKNTFRFTDELFYSLKELGDNILKHSSYREGIISWRIYKIEDFRVTFGNDITPETFDKDVKRLIDINVFDLGETGIIPSLKKHTTEILSKIKNDIPTLKEGLEDDLKKLDNGYTVSNLLDTSNPSDFLFQQTKRSIAHLGLLILAKLIEQNKGAILASSNDSGHYISSNLNVKSPSFIEGTKFNILIPFSTFSQKFELKPIKTFPIVHQNFALDKILRYKYIELHQLDKDEKSTRIINLSTINSKFEELTIWKDLFLEIDKTSINQGDVFHLDLHNVEFTESVVFRLLGKWEMEFPNNALILSNVRVENFNKLIDINDKYFQALEGSIHDLPYWNSKSIFLFFSYIEKEDEKFYFIDALSGKTKKDFLAINSIISKTHKNLYSEVIDTSNLDPNNNIDLSFFPTLFYKSQSLFPIDAVIKIEDKTIFEYNASFLLNCDLNKGYKAEILDKELLFPGYKLSDTHFRLGSKVHISDFYFAKKFFQNSRFANRFGYIIARFIIDTYPITDLINNGGITLFGYGRYSTLLLSLIEAFLFEYFDEKAKINYDVLIDSGNENYFLKKSTFYKNAIIIVPISTTFSTTIKIAQQIFKNGIGETHILNPNINVVHVGANGYKDINIEEFGINSDPAKGTLSVTPFYDPNALRKEQKIFLPLKGTWYSADNCKLCGVKDSNIDLKSLKEERLLLRTDNSSVTPSAVFDVPPKRINSINKDFLPILTAEMVYDNIIKAGSSEYPFFIDGYSFFHRNYDDIKDWLFSLKEQFNYDNEKIVILASGYKAVNRFVYLVNKILFHSSATIIHFAPDVDRLQNFTKIYRDLILSANRIIFVDDVLSSGASLTKINFYLKHIDFKNSEFSEITEKNSDLSNRIDKCLFIINRASLFAYNNIKLKLKNKDSNPIHTFLDINLPNFERMGKTSRFTYVTDNYIYLLNNSTLNKLRTRFYKLIIGNYPLNIIDAELQSKTKRDLKLDKILTFHQIISTIHIFHGDEEVSFADFSKNVYNADKPFKHSITEEKQKNLILKLLTYYPLIEYDRLKLYAFEWVKESFQKFIASFKNAQEITNSDWKKLQFYSRRAALLDSNIILSEEYLNLVKKFVALQNFEYRKVENLLYPTSNMLRSNLSYLASQIKELTYKNEGKSILVEHILSKRMVDIRHDTLFGQFIRVLIYENNALLNSYCTHLDNYIAQQYPNNNYDLEEVFKSSNVINHYKYKVLQKFLKVSNSTLNPLDSFKKYYDIRKNIAEDIVNQKSIDGNILQNKNRELCNAIKAFIQYQSELISKVKCFLIIRTKPFSLKMLENNDITYYNAYLDNSITLGVEGSETNLAVDQSNFLIDFLKGTSDESDSIKTLTELKRIDASKWLDLYDLKENSDSNVIKFEERFIDLDINRILLIRINDNNVDKKDINITKNELNDDGTGLLGFVYQSKDETESILNPFIVRYLLLLRQDLSKYISRHHEGDEFHDLFQTRKRWKLEAQFSQLMGHNRDVLLKLATRQTSNGFDFRKLLNTQQTAQLFFFHDIQNRKYTDQSRLKMKMKLNTLLSVESNGIISSSESYDFKNIYKLAEEVYSSNLIEMQSLVDIDDSSINYEELQFKHLAENDFPIDLYQFICFEILLNSKKNRYHFVDQNEKNELIIEIGYNSDQKLLKTTIKNTFANYQGRASQIVTSLNIGDYIREGSREHSGLRIIDAILDLYDGSINFEIDTLDSPGNIDIDYFETSFSIHIG